MLPLFHFGGREEPEVVGHSLRLDAADADRYLDAQGAHLPRPRPSERTITVSYDYFLVLLDAFADCAQGAYNKLKQLDDLYAMLPGNDEVSLRKVLDQNKQEQQAVAQMLTDLRAMRSEADHQAG